VKWLVAIALLSGCVSVPLNPDAKPYTLTDSEQQIVEKSVKEVLIDPPSALFNDDFRAAKSTDGSIFVCGYVNAKNRFGGYTGNKMFTGIMNNDPSGNRGTQFGVDLLEGPSYGRQIVINTCKKRGVSPP